MGWLFAVALGMQEHSWRTVVRSLGPITLGHAAAIGVVVFLAGLLQVVLPLNYLKIIVALALVSLGIYKIFRSRHFRWGGMRVGFRDLTLWSFLMASAHGAGLMVVPVVLGMNRAPAGHGMHMQSAVDPMMGVWATLIHTLGYLAVTAVVALLVYRWLGLALLRKAWINLDIIWAVALIATGGLALII
jgi:hypothetical protein